MKQPRRFSHSFIYVDQRRERLAEIEQRARHELGLDQQDTYNPERLRGMFSRTKTDTTRQTFGSRLRRKGLSMQTLLLLLVLLFLIWKLLL